ncbi:extracellular solute-binding protein [Paenibacillus azoreducens]|uniref:extracellular solute-binding protein n=1 Tax=Paenibacillus azoreducens TaxID=116718 RepID=UPI0039F64338
MNTALLSGKGADIYDLGSLPNEEYEQYVSKQLLLNMNDYMQQDQTLNKNDLKMSILDALKLKGGLYTVPSGYFMRPFVGDGNAIQNSGVKIDDKTWNWKTFDEISRQLIQQANKGGKKQLYALANNPPEVTLQEMVVDSYSGFVNREAKKVQFDSPAFIELLQQVKKMYDAKVITSDEAKMGNQLFYSSVIMSPADLIDGPYSAFENPVLLQKPHSGQSGGIRIIPTSQFGIQAKSPVKEEAWKFISFMLSDEAQSLNEREGFSLLTSVNNKKLDELQEKVKSGSYKLPTGKEAKVPDEAFTKFKQIVQDADQYAGLDGKVISIVGEEAASFFGGQKSAEEVAKLIQNRTTTFINE